MIVLAVGSAQAKSSRRGVSLGGVTGRCNKARTKVSGTWRLTFIYRNAAGVTTDTCDSGALAWSAQQ